MVRHGLSLRLDAGGRAGNITRLSCAGQCWQAGPPPDLPHHGATVGQGRGHVAGVVGVVPPGANNTPEVVVNVENVGQQRLGGDLLLLHLLHLLLHHDCLPGDLLSRPRHSEEPGDPLQEYYVDLGRRIMQDSLIVLREDQI